jgi:hypothetical protein
MVDVEDGRIGAYPRMAVAHLVGEFPVRHCAAAVQQAQARPPPPFGIGTVVIMAGIAWMFDVFEADLRLLVHASIALAMYGLLDWAFIHDLEVVRAWPGRGL